MAVDPYASGVLRRDVHERLVADIERYAADANIQPRWVWTPLADVCKPAELTWVKRFRFHTEENRNGLCYVGADPDPGIETRMAAIAGALTRNFIRARMLTVNQLLEDPLDTVHVTCLLIPNFFIEKKLGGTQQAWRISALYDLLLSRAVAGQQSVLYASDMDALGKEYGAAIRSHLQASYELLEV